MAECSKCGDLVYVADGLDWNDETDVCWDCLLNECGRLKRELDAAVELHKRWTDKLKELLPSLSRFPGDLLENVAQEIELLKATAVDQHEAEDALQGLEQECAEYWTIKYDGSEWFVWDRYGCHAGEACCIGCSPSFLRAVQEAIGIVSLRCKR